MSRINFGDQVRRPSMQRDLGDPGPQEPEAPPEPPKKKPGRKRVAKAEPVRQQIPPAMAEKLRDEHADGSTVEQLVARWGLLEEEVNHALGNR